MLYAERTVSREPIVAGRGRARSRDARDAESGGEVAMGCWRGRRRGGSCKNGCETSKKNHGCRLQVACGGCALFTTRRADWSVGGC